MRSTHLRAVSHGLCTADADRQRPTTRAGCHQRLARSQRRRRGRGATPTATISGRPGPAVSRRNAPVPSAAAGGAPEPPQSAPIPLGWTETRTLATRSSRRPMVAMIGAGSCSSTRRRAVLRAVAPAWRVSRRRRVSAGQPCHPGRGRLSSRRPIAAPIHRAGGPHARDAAGPRAACIFHSGDRIRAGIRSPTVRRRDVEIPSLEAGVPSVVARPARRSSPCLPSLLTISALNTWGSKHEGNAMSFRLTTGFSHASAWRQTHRFLAASLCAVRRIVRSETRPSRASPNVA